MTMSNTHNDSISGYGHYYSIAPEQHITSYGAKTIAA